MENKKLSLDAFKQMAESVQTEDVMRQVEGGLEGWGDCHGYWGKLGKYFEMGDPIHANYP
ncbi:hypothetical protein NAT51_05195 [Flavobacterium amniphilum]|uniref:hypothetical protein n=1 Tax=Flavobacterium amniphilum TaxID=1834035 RepID=UPI00202A6CC6|nr:hypothetical protein [Flavobacterium amniphilum]MCL9804904.1 hypothetical protein [Flavobacterium amniphilum]